MRLRTYLVLMSAAILIPVIAFHAAALNMLEDAERESTFKQLDEKVHTISLLVERELSGADTTLRILASSRYLRSENFQALYEQAKLANNSTNKWFVLLDMEGQQLINTRFAYGTPLVSPPQAKERIQKLMTYGKSAVSEVVYGPGTDKLVTTLATPVTLENGKRYVLLAVFSANYFIDLIETADISNDWVAGLLDGQGKFIARTLDTDSTIGKPTMPRMKEIIRTETKGMIPHQTLEGVASYNSFRRIANTNWTVSIAAPKQAIDAASNQAARIAGLGMGVGVIFATLLALVFGGRIVRAIKLAKTAAGQLGHRTKPAFEKSNITEVNELYTALSDAGEQLSRANDSRLLAEARASEAGELLQLAVDSAELGTFYCPLPLGKIYWNATCKRHFFLDDESEIDISVFYDRIHPDDREPTRIAVEAAVFHHSEYDAEYRTISPDGRTRWIRAKGRAYYDLDDRPIRFDGITIDISRNKEVEARLEKDSRQKDEFLAMLAHELRNPLAPIASAASLLRLSTPDTAKVTKTSDIITRQVKHMAGLLDDLLDVSRVTKGIIKLNKDVVDIKKVIAASVEQTQPLMHSKNHEFLTELDSEPIYVIGDEKRLIQIVVNLLVNAAKYTNNKGHIKLTLEADADNLLINVKDDGIGISPHLKDHIFDLFAQGERTPDRQLGGLGLGLPLVKSLVEHHNGSVHVFSEGSGQGSVFTIKLPRHYLSDHSTDHTPDVVIDRPIGFLKITVVDDNSDAAQMLAMLLEALGHQVQVDTNPLETLVRSIERQSDVFILDIGMPGMDGYQLARRLRSQKETSHAYLIAMSGYGQNTDVESSMAAGFNHHLIKPVDIQTLSMLLEKLCLKNKDF